MIKIYSKVLLGEWYDYHRDGFKLLLAFIAFLGRTAKDEDLTELQVNFIAGDFDVQAEKHRSWHIWHKEGAQRAAAVERAYAIRKNAGRGVW